MAEPADGSLSLTEAAERLGLHPKTVRQRIKDGKLPAVKVDGPRGPEWRVYPDGVPFTDRSRTLDGPSMDSPWTDPTASVESPSADPEPTVNSPSVQGESAVVLEALRLVDSLRRDNQQLAGQVGFLQAKLQDAQEENQQLRLLMAPKDEPSEPEPPAEPERVRWWKRLWGG